MVVAAWALAAHVHNCEVVWLVEVEATIGRCTRERLDILSTHGRVTLPQNAFSVTIAWNQLSQVTGPAVLALAQMAQHDSCRHAIVQAGGVPPLVLLCFKNQSSAVLTQVSWHGKLGSSCLAS